MKNKLAAELRKKYEDRVRQAATKRNALVLQANEDFKAEVKVARKEIYGDS